MQVPAKERNYENVLEDIADLRKSSKPCETKIKKYQSEDFALRRFQNNRSANL